MDRRNGCSAEGQMAQVRKEVNETRTGIWMVTSDWDAIRN